MYPLCLRLDLCTPFWGSLLSTILRETLSQDPDPRATNRRAGSLRFLGLYAA